MTTTLLTLALLLPAAPVPAPKDTTPKGPPPRVVVVSVQPDGAPFIQHTRTQMVPEQRARAVQVGQQVQTVTETVRVPVMVTVNLMLDGKGVEVYGADGKKIDPKDVRKRVAKPVAALISADGKPVDPFYLRLAREGTLVIVVPATDADGPPLRKDFSAPDQPKKDVGPKQPVEKRLPVEKR